MNKPSFKEDHISQIPALQMLIKLGYIYITQTEAEQLRGSKTSNVILDKVLREQLKSINKVQLSSTSSTEFSDGNIEAAIRKIKEVDMVEGYINASAKIYSMLTMGIALPQTVNGNTKDFTMQYIDWENFGNNKFHVAEEFSVMRTGSKQEYRPDIVLFVNGIPLCVIECKRPDMKKPITQAISQHLRNQQEDGIRNLFKYCQLLLSIAVDKAGYATLGTKEKFWSKWKEKFKTSKENERYTELLYRLKNEQVESNARQKLFSERYAYVKNYFEELDAENVLPTLQDEYLHGLCRPERLLDFAHNFTLYDAGIKKVARYQQFFAVKKAMAQLKPIEAGKRKGGVIWHTQGSGKSLTMVMLAQAIALEPAIVNPKIVLVTDRTDLDEQITETFKKCDTPVLNAKTGSHLVELLNSSSDAVITTIINKFETAVKKIKGKLENPDIFVLVDEGHRTQHGTFNIEMQKTLPNACFIAFTGTPLFKKDKSTLTRFGILIDTYTVDMAVKDKAVVPLIYEGRHAKQQVNESPLDTFFANISEPLTQYEKADLKKKFSRADQLNIAEQKILANAWDISKHYRDNFQTKTPFKGQLVCQNKDAALKYKKYLDEIGLVSSELLISPPDTREGEESAYGERSDLVNTFWKKMMDEHGSPKKYQKNLISRYKNQEAPEIIIVVDKLLTGFDAPINTVLYLTRKLKGHTLLQAIARVNRIHPDKLYGYVIDYYGVISELDDALETYTDFESFDANDLEGTLVKISDEIKKLPQAHSELLELFKTIENKLDAEAYQQLLRDEALRAKFYDKYRAFGHILKLALSSIEFHNNTAEKNIKDYKIDLSFFSKLRTAVSQRYSDSVDYRKYEGQIQKLIDTHIPAEQVEVITELVEIFDKDAFQDEVENTIGTAAKADKIRSRTAMHISQKMDDDEAFYKRFSQMLNDTIKAFEERRISELEYLNKTKEIMNKVLLKQDDEVPEAIANNESARAYFGILKLSLVETKVDSVDEIALNVAVEADKIIHDLKEVDWPSKVDVCKKMVFNIGEFILDEICKPYDLKLSFTEIDDIAEKIIENAKRRA